MRGAFAGVAPRRVTRTIAHDFGEAVAIDGLIHALITELVGLVEGGASTGALGVPDEAAGSDYQRDPSAEHL